MRKKVRILLLQLCFVLLCTQLYAKEPPPPPNDMAPQPGLPIDGGLIYLVLSAVGFGIYAVRKKN
ncbi:MAG TPA: hypothetical protein VJ970_05505 [Flavobacteriaceae bacterium]|nr:hypothetical protein [Flavobacteriaceae bacterium]